MQLELKRTIVVLVYWSILSLLVGWIAHQSELIEILELAILYTLGFCASVFFFKSRFIKNRGNQINHLGGVIPRTFTKG